MTAADSALGPIVELASSPLESWEAAWTECPKLLTTALQQRLRTGVEGADATRRESVGRFLDYLVERREFLDAHPEKYPFGRGPVEALARLMESGQISFEQAYADAQKSAVAGVLSATYVNALAFAAMAMLRADEWMLALPLEIVLSGALSVIPDNPSTRRSHRVVAFGMLSAATRALTEAPDAFVLRIAKDGAVAFISTLAPDRDGAERAGALHDLGVLYLDPYTANRPVKAYGPDIDMWATRYLPGRQTEDLTILTGPDLAARGVPEPSVALKMAARYFREALPGRSGIDRALTLKALATARAYQRMALNKAVGRGEILQLAREAMSGLQDPRYRGHALTLEAICANLDEPAGPAAPVSLEPLDALLRQHRKPGARDYVLAVAGQSLRRAELLPWLDSMRPLFDATAPDVQRIKLWEFELRAVCEQGLGAEGSLSDSNDLDRRIATFAEDATEGPGKALRALDLALSCSEADRDILALDCFEGAMNLYKSLVSSHPDAVRGLHANLLANAACEAFGAGDRGGALELDLRAAAAFGAASLSSSALLALARAADIAAKTGTQPGDRAVLQAIWSVASIAPQWEARLGLQATRHLQVLYQAGLRLLYGGSSSLVPLLGAAKGARFAASLRSWSPETSRFNLDARRLAEIRMLEHELEGHDVIRDIYPLDAGLDENTLLVVPQGSAKRQEGRDAAQRLANLQMDVDRALNESVLSSQTPEDRGGIPSDEARQGCLDARTVLVDVYQAQGNRKSDVIVSLSTRETTECVVGQWPGHGAMTIGGVARLEGFSYLGTGIRQRIAVDPGPRRVDSEARGLLQSGGQMLFADCADILARHRASGKDHLCIIPHGALHYCPMHLFEHAGKLLADDWIVTYLPNGELLAPRSAAPERTTEMVALGVTFVGTPLELQYSLSECMAVAELFGTQPLMDEKASAAAMVAAFESSRYVHISSHGRHNVLAPAFQALLANGGEVLHAYELVGRDFRGLRVLSLSACETGLGRFDDGDNLNGLPATFFLGGVQTLIGTLWPVASGPAETFFVTFYGALREPQPRCDAFAAAQAATRKKFPQYRHWGPFFMSGAWS